LRKNILGTQFIIAIPGVALVLYSVHAFFVSGFGPSRGIAGLVGLVLLSLAFFDNPVRTWLAGVLQNSTKLLWKPRRSFPQKVFRIIEIAAVWAVILIVGLVGSELYVRHRDGYILSSAPPNPVTKNGYFALDVLKIWNRSFVNSRPEYFQDWPIPLTLFDSDKLTPRYFFKPNLKMALRDGQFVPAKPADPIEWSSNSWGLRGAEFSIKKAANTIRIVCLGASTTEGSQSDVETYPYFLQQVLNKRFPNAHIEVINAGFHGQDTNDLVEIYRQKVLPLKPDIIIFYEGNNDIWLPEYYATPQSCRDYGGMCWLEGFPRWYAWLYTYSAAFRSVVDKSNSPNYPPIQHTFDDTSPKPSAESYANNLRTIVKEAQAQGTVILLSSFVTVAHDGLSISYSQNPGMYNDLYQAHSPLTPGEIARVFRYVNKMSAQVAVEYGAPYVDVAATFPRDPKYFPFDLIHLTPDGNQILANSIADFLAANVLAKFEAQLKN